MTSIRSRHTTIILLGILFVLFPFFSTGAEQGETVTIIDMQGEPDVQAGEPFSQWMKNKNWENPFGDPRYFFIQNGDLHLVSKAGPVYEDRYMMAVFNRDKLINQIENKVMLQLTGEDFRIDPDTYPLLKFVMTPVELPSPEADLRDSDKNDSAFYLLVFFDTERHDFHGYQMPKNIGYVWANREWSEPVASDPDYDEIMRYIPIGSGPEELGQEQTITRRISEDFLAAYPDYETVPDIINIGLMIDSNTLEGRAESSLSRIWFAKKPSQ